MLNKSRFIQRVSEIHNNKYCYYDIQYVNTLTPINILCPIHGYFTQTPKNHLKGQGCPICGKEKARNSHKGQYEQFLNRASELFGNKYTFPNISEEYENTRSLITIKCLICGNVYKKRAIDFLQSTNGGCKCKLKNIKTIDFNSLLLLSNNRDIISFSGYKNIDDIIFVVCPIHNITYKTTIFDILQKKNRCPKCNVKINKKEIEFRNKLKELCGDKITYKSEDFINLSTPLQFYCTTCNKSFKRIPYTFFQGKLQNVCPFESKKESNNIKTKTTEQYILDVKRLYGNEAFDFTNTQYTLSKNKVTLKCNKCNRYFTIEANSLLQGHSCPYHYCNQSKPEEEIADFIRNLGFQVETHNRNIINDKELDIYIPELNIAIEYDGIYWHNELFKNKNYHLDKTIDCLSKNIRLIHIFEDEWIEKKDIWKSMLSNFLGKTINKIYARKCCVKEVNAHIANEFLENNHIQGVCPSTIKLGLYYENELVSLMTFGKSRHFIGNCKYEYELLRFCNKINTTVIGGASKLFNYFVKSYHPMSVVSYADRRWSNGNLYEKLGFTFSHYSKPNYFYVIDNKRRNRFNFRKSILSSKYNCPSNLSEKEFCRLQKWYRIYDCGTFCFYKIF